MTWGQKVSYYISTVQALGKGPMHIKQFSGHNDTYGVENPYIYTPHPRPHNPLAWQQTATHAGPTAAADNVGLYVGIAVPVGLVINAATVIMILMFVIHKKRGKKIQAKHKQSGKH